jgi:hypothetical protein
MRIVNLFKAQPSAALIRGARIHELNNSLLHRYMNVGGLTAYNTPHFLSWVDALAQDGDSEADEYLGLLRQKED